MSTYNEIGTLWTITHRPYSLKFNLVPYYNHEEWKCKSESSNSQCTESCLIEHTSLLAAALPGSHTKNSITESSRNFFRESSLEWVASTKVWHCTKRPHRHHRTQERRRSSLSVTSTRSSVRQLRKTAQQTLSPRLGKSTSEQHLPLVMWFETSPQP